VSGASEVASCLPQASTIPILPIAGLKIFALLAICFLTFMELRRKIFNNHQIRAGLVDLSEDDITLIRQEA
jgi:hypothetical protein